MDDRIPKNRLADSRTDEPRRVEINPASEQIGQFPFDGEEGQPRRPPRLELDEEIDVAVGAEIVAQGGTEEREAADPVLASEGGDGFPVDGRGPHDAALLS